MRLGSRRAPAAAVGSALDGSAVRGALTAVFGLVGGCRGQLTRSAHSSLSQSQKGRVCRSRCLDGTNRQPISTPLSVLAAGVEQPDDRVALLVGGLEVDL